SRTLARTLRRYSDAVYPEACGMRTSSSITIGLAALIVSAGICAPHLGAQSAMPRQQSPEQVFADSPNVWFEEYATRARVSPDGREVAFSRAGATDSVFAGPLGSARAYPVAGVVTGFAWLPDGGSLVVIALEPRGASTLSRLDLASGHATVVARDLDAPTLFSPVAVAP